MAKTTQAMFNKLKEHYGEDALKPGGEGWKMLVTKVAEVEEARTVAPADIPRVIHANVKRTKRELLDVVRTASMFVQSLPLISGSSLKACTYTGI